MEKMDKSRVSRLCARVLGFSEQNIYYKWHEKREVVVRLHDKLLAKLDNISLEFRDLKKTVRLAGELLLDYIESIEGLAEFPELTLDQYSQLKDAQATLPELIRKQRGKEKMLEEQPTLAIMAPVESTTLITPPPDEQLLDNNDYFPEPLVEEHILAIEEAKQAEVVEDQELKLGGKDISKVLNHFYRPIKGEKKKKRTTFKIELAGIPSNWTSPEWPLARVLDGAEGPLTEYILNCSKRARNTLLDRHPELLKLIKN